MDNRAMSLDAAKKLLISNGYREETAERIIATAGLHEGRLREIATFEASTPMKDMLSKYLAIYPPSAVRHAIQSGVSLDDNHRMAELVKIHGKNYAVDRSALPRFKRLTPEPCSQWTENLKAVLAATQGAKAGTSHFSARFELKCSGELASEADEGYRRGGFSLVMYPSAEDALRLEKEGARLDYNYEHQPGSLGFARFYVSDGRLIVSELQSDLFKSGWHDSVKARNAIRKRYEHWGNCLLSSLEQVARNAGLKEIVMSTAEHIGGKYSVDPHKLFKTYSELPQSEGYSLFETPAPVAILGKERAKTVFWKKAL